MTTTKQDDANSQAGEVRSSDQLGMEPERSAFEQWWFDEATVDALEGLSTVEQECRLSWDAAVAAERERFVEMLEYAMSLDGFGCACEPARKCGTCQARDTVKKALGPLLRTLKA